jgi:hypothetical protein
MHRQSHMFQHCCPESIGQAKVVVVSVAVELCYRKHWVLRDADLCAVGPWEAAVFLSFPIACLNSLRDSAI